MNLDFNTEKRLNLKNFLFILSQFQKQYKEVNETIKRNNVSASEISYAYQLRNQIAEKVVRFILEENVSVEIFNNLLIENEKSLCPECKTKLEGRLRYCPLCRKYFKILRKINDEY